MPHKHRPGRSALTRHFPPTSEELDAAIRSPDGLGGLQGREGSRRMSVYPDRRCCPSPTTLPRSRRSGTPSPPEPALLSGNGLQPFDGEFGIEAAGLRQGGVFHMNSGTWPTSSSCRIKSWRDWPAARWKAKAKGNLLEGMFETTTKEIRHRKHPETWKLQARTWKADAAPRMVWVHWVLFNIPPSTTSLSEGVGTLPAGTGEGLNDWKRTGYGGPAPPPSMRSSASRGRQQKPSLRKPCAATSWLRPR